MLLQRAQSDNKRKQRPERNRSLFSKMETQCDIAFWFAFQGRMISLDTRYIERADAGRSPGTSSIFARATRDSRRLDLPYEPLMKIKI